MHRIPGAAMDARHKNAVFVSVKLTFRHGLTTFLHCLSICTLVTHKLCDSRAVSVRSIDNDHT